MIDAPLPWSEISALGILLIQDGTVVLVSGSLTPDELLIALPVETKTAILAWVAQLGDRLGMKIQAMYIYPRRTAVGPCPSAEAMLVYLQEALPPGVGQEEPTIKLTIDPIDVDGVNLRVLGSGSWTGMFEYTQHPPVQAFAAAMLAWLPGLAGMRAHFVLGGSAHAQISRLARMRERSQQG